jgi:4-hydroxy-tetrahydrodipicolinate synthase
MKKLYGTGVALITPFTEQLEVDYKALKKILAHTARGADYYVVMGTTGEAATVSDDEKREILQFIKNNNTAKLPIVYGIGGNNTQHELDQIASADLKGVDAILSVSPYYSKPSQEGIYQHFKALADACPIPVILYNIPGRTSSNLTAETMLRLAAHKNIIGVKEASGNLEQCMKVMREAPRDFMVVSGDDMLTVALYALGSRGVISVLANAYPGIFRKMKDHAFGGSYPKAAGELYKLLDINPAMYEEANPVGVKYLMSLMGLCQPFVRLPLVPASEGLRKKIEKLYAQVKK